jgi:hypothetical protein
VRLEGLVRSTEKSSDIIGNRTRDLPACSLMPQPTTLPCAPYLFCKFTLLPSARFRNVFVLSHIYIEGDSRTSNPVSRTLGLIDVVHSSTEVKKCLGRKEDPVGKQFRSVPYSDSMCPTSKFCGIISRHIYIYIYMPCKLD